MTRSNPSERRSRRRSANHPSTPLSATAENRRKRRLMASRKRSPNPNGPVAPPQGREGQPNRRITHPAQTTAYPPVPPFPAPSTNAAPPAYYLPPAPPYPESSSQSYPNQGGQPNGTSRGATKDIHFGPSPRRRHELSSNPAFGQSPQRQRHGQSRRRQSGVNSGHSTMAQPRNPKTVDLAAPGQHSPHLLRQPGTRQTGLSPLGPRPFGPATVSGQTVRTQSLQPRPVSRSRSGSRSGNRSAGGAIAPHPDAKRLAPSQSRALGRPKQRRRPPKPVSPVVYGLRLLILGTGVGVIAGTVISAFNPDQVMPTANMADVAALGPQAGNEGGTSRTASMGGMGEGLPASELAIAGMNTISKQKPYTELVRELEQMGQAQEGLIPSIFVLDLDTYNYVDVNGSTSFAAASTIKVPILVAFFQDVEQNKIDLDEMLTMTEEDIATGSGDMQYGTVGQ
ncbi:MAG: serine hydrolase, partial [Leptolyngbyaceae bacterium]|nr:serine hydrolase [Leptolyngbyaceae bacterium]